MKTKLDLYIIDKVREKRIEKGLSLENFGYAVNLSQSFCAHCENFRLDKKYNINHVHTFARFFGCSLYDFLPQYPIDD
jgi:predicted transcriptional regulator